MGQRLAGAHAAELERRQAGALALQQWSAQQQQRGAPSRPTTTTCRDVAGTLTCDTF